MILMTDKRRRQLKYFGHILWRIFLAKDCLLGFVEGTSARGRQRMKYMDGVKSLIQCEDVGGFVRLAENRERWRSIVANGKIDTAHRSGKVTFLKF